jgi:hypothetical protein
MNAFGPQLRQNGVEKAGMLFFHKLMDFSGNSSQGRRSAGTVSGSPAVIAMVLQMGKPNHKKFI